MGHPTVMYRGNGDAVEARTFDSDAIPEGWVDSPAKVGQQEPRPPQAPVRRKKGRR